MNYRLSWPIFLSLFTLNLSGVSAIVSASDVPCPDGVRTSTEEVESVIRFGADGMQIGVGTMETAVVQEVEKSLASFRVTTLGLAGQSMSKEGIAEWYANIQNLNRVAFNTINNMGFMQDSGAIGRLAALLVNGAVSYWLTQASGTALHEGAHRDGQLASGATETYFGLFENDDKKLTLGELYLGLLTTRKRAYAGAEYDDPLSARQKAGVAAAGMNANSKFAEDLEKDAILRDAVQPADTAAYLYNKLYMFGYFATTAGGDSDDPSSYVRRLAIQRGLDQGQEEQLLNKVKAFALLSAVMSGRTLDHIIANFRYIKDGETSTPVLGVNTPHGKITLPDFSVYLNADSVSLKGSTSFIMKEGGVISLGVEKTLGIDGPDNVPKRDVTEVSVGLNIPLSKRVNLDLMLRGNSELAYGASVDLAYNITDQWHLIAGFDYDRNTLAGDRRHNRFGSMQAGDGLVDRNQGAIQTYVGVGYHF